MNRRKFLTRSALAAVGVGAPMIVPASIFGKSAPSNRIEVGFIGIGRQGFTKNLPQMMAVPGVQVTTVCDVDSWRMDEAAKAVDQFYAASTKSSSYKSCIKRADFRELLSDKSINALMVSTPDHWHVRMGIMAAQAGKHFAMEKPISLSVAQGRMLADAVKRYGVTARTDSEFRSLRVQNHAVELVRNGHIGKLERIEIFFPSDPAPVGPQPDMPVPKELNYNMWLGPAQDVPYTEKRVHDRLQNVRRPNWMRVSSYAQGMISNWGAHYFDLAQWANKGEGSGPTEVEGHGEFPESLWNTMINFEVSYRYANGVMMTCAQTPTSKPSIQYFGSDGWLKVSSYPGTLTSSNSALLEREPGPGEVDFSGSLWDKNDFIASIREKREPLETIEDGHRAISISQIGLIACQLGKKLQWDPQKEKFVDNNYADSLLSAPVERTGWAI